MLGTFTSLIVLEYQMYLCLGSKFTKLASKIYLYGPQILVYFRRVCTETPCISIYYYALTDKCQFTFKIGYLYLTFLCSKVGITDHNSTVALVFLELKN